MRQGLGMKKTRKSEMFILPKTRYISEMFILFRKSLFLGYNILSMTATHSTCVELIVHTK
jgi:hypothetical protein